MTTDYIRYDILAQNALRGVVRTVMADAAKKGLAGDHHFKISFNTTSPGVKLSPRLRAQYPQEMTIVLQHQFWDLEVTEEAFEVGLSFSGIPERLRVPFDAIVGFFDPSVEFGLQFTTVVEEEEGEEDGEAPAEADIQPLPTPTPVERMPAPKPATGPRAVPSPSAKDDKPDGDGDDDKPTGGAEVVRLDRFRKK
jgi:hypothetical protein